MIPFEEARSQEPESRILLEYASNNLLVSTAALAEKLCRMSLLLENPYYAYRQPEQIDLLFATLSKPENALLLLYLF
jgi:hypothetical protein